MMPKKGHMCGVIVLGNYIEIMDQLSSAIMGPRFGVKMINIIEQMVQPLKEQMVTESGYKMVNYIDRMGQLLNTPMGALSGGLGTKSYRKNNIIEEWIIAEKDVIDALKHRTYDDICKVYEWVNDARQPNRTDGPAIEFDNGVKA